MELGIFWLTVQNEDLGNWPKPCGPVKITNGDCVNDFTPEQDLQAYRDMLLIRRFEEKAGPVPG